MMQPKALDREQALVLAALRERDGAVTYEELRERGVAFPASVVEELELAGLEVERSWELEASGERRVSAIRLVGGTRSQPSRSLQPAPEPAAAAAEAPTLQLGGRRAAAVPVLERRLQIDNQRATVREALEGARTPT